MPKKDRFSYDRDDFRKALEVIRSKHMSTKAASSTFGIPRTTLSDNLKIKDRGGTLVLGRPPLFTIAEEELLVNAVLLNAKRHLPMTRTNLTAYATDVLNAEIQNENPRPHLHHYFPKFQNESVHLGNKWIQVRY